MKNRQQLYILIQILALVFYVILNLGLTFSRGVCCADDGVHADIAKNLADGIGYASTLPASQVHYKVTPFDPELGVGPTVILPAAILIKLFGNTYWVPGLTEVLIWSVLLFIIGFFLNKIVENKLGLTIATLVFFYFCYTFTAYHSEEWWALLGEIPAVLLIILAILVYFYKDSKLNLILIGVLFSLAYQAKVVALLPFGVFFITIVLIHIYRKRKDRIISPTSILHQLLLIVLGFFIPTLLFEFWKLLVLQISGYLDWWSRFLVYFSTLGIGSELTAFERIGERIGTAIERFGIFLPALLLLLPFIGWGIKREKKLFQIFLVLASIIFVYTIYWIFSSIGWARYYIIPLILMILVLVFPFLSMGLSKKIKIIYAIILAAISFYNIKSIRVDYPLNDIILYRPNSRTLSQKETVAILASQIDRRPFYTQWWATAVDLEYLLDTHVNFNTVYDPEADFSEPFILVAHTGFLLLDLPEVTEILQNCNKKEIGPYIYGECPPLSEP